MDLAFAQEVAKVLQKESDLCLEEPDRDFVLGLSGGSVIDVLSVSLPLLKTDWQRWRFIFCDERHVPEDDPESTVGLYLKKVFEPLKIPSDRIHKVDTSLPVEQAAKEYNVLVSSLPSLDVLILGMGPDGHTCSLFPGHRLLGLRKEDDPQVSFLSDSPKPPPERVTLTLRGLERARHILFIARGSGKKTKLQEIFSSNTGHDAYPAGMIGSCGSSRCVRWLVDGDAAEELPSGLKGTPLRETESGGKIFYLQR